MKIGDKILSLRKKQGITQEELAEVVGVSRQTISKWELDETSPDLKQAKKLSEIFKVSIDELASNNVENILVNKVSNTEKLAGIIIKVIKVIGILIVSLVIIDIIALIIFTLFIR